MDELPILHPLNKVQPFPVIPTMCPTTKLLGYDGEFQSDFRDVKKFSDPFNQIENQNSNENELDLFKL